MTGTGRGRRSDLSPPTASHSLGPAEVEFKLVPLGPDPERSLQEVVDLDVLAGHDLGPPRRHAIRDVYWDTPAGDLGALRATLRVRQIDGETRFTLKGGGRSKRGLFTRQELEVPADAEGWLSICAELSALGIALPVAAPEPPPLSWPAAAGLVATQDRSTSRLARPVSLRGVEVAELAVDTTEYRFGNRRFTHHEVEIEQHAGAGSIARTLGEALLKLMPAAFAPATEGKYARGLRIARSLGEQATATPQRGPSRARRREIR